MWETAQRFYYFFDRRLIGHFPIAIAVSERIRQTLIEHGADPRKVRSIRNGIDAMKFRRSQTPRQQVRGCLGAPITGTWVVGVGRLEQEKRLDVLLEAVAQIEPTTVAGVILAGDGICRSLLEQRAAARDLRDRVYFLGHVTDVRPVYEAGDIFAQSSDTEGIPNAVLEAMAMETPAVATDVGGTSELIIDGVDGLLMPRRNPGALALALKRTVLVRPRVGSGTPGNALRTSCRSAAEPELSSPFTKNCSATRPREADRRGLSTLRSHV